MKVSLLWLREFVDLPSTVSELVELLTLAGVEVEGVSTQGVSIANVVIAQVRESVPHPNADRLSVCQVDDGSASPRQIVCGAKNYRVGDKVPLALPGATLPGDFTIKVGKLRGVESQGMLCSAEELGLPKGEDGLLILSPAAQVGKPLSTEFPGDTILDLEITPNRPDLLSHLGIAREIAALTRQALQLPKRGKELGGFAEAVIDVETSACRFYSALEITNLKVADSPEWLRRRLEGIGLRSINNVVDVTNLVMFECGQPLHAFDADKLVGAVRVRMATAGEQLLTLDGKTVTLTPEHLVIADEQRPIALGGVMGGAETGVTAETRNVLLESAWFEPTVIRRTSRALGLASDSSYRFERGVDLAGVLPAAQRAAELIAEVAAGVPGKLSLGLADDSPAGFDPGATLAENDGYVYTHTVAFRPTRARALLGLEMRDERLAEVLEGFGLRRAEGGWEIPSFRQDLTREVDLVEEVARVIGIAAVPARVQAQFAPASNVDAAYDQAMALRQSLVGCGFHEARSLTLVPGLPLGLKYGGGQAENLHRVSNPMIEDQVALRPNLLHGLLTSLRQNLRVGEKAIRLFEVGRVYSRTEPEEGTHLGVLLSGAVEAGSWRDKEPRAADLYDLKGALATVLGRRTSFEMTAEDSLALSMAVKAGEQVVGFLGQLWPADARALDATSPVLIAELDLGLLAAATPAKGGARYQAIPRFPSTSRDVAFLAPLALTHQEVESVLTSSGEPLLKQVQLFDVFSDPSGARLPADKKSLAYSLTYQASDRTLTADEVNTAHARLKELLKGRLGVSLRE